MKQIKLHEGLRERIVLRQTQELNNKSQLTSDPDNILNKFKVETAMLIFKNGKAADTD